MTREEAIKILKSRVEAIELTLKVLESEPVKHGRWIDRGKDMCIRWECSECGRKDMHIYNYCPNCGADMREVEE